MNTVEGFKKGRDLVARVAHTNDQGWMAYDTDLSYMIYAEWGALSRFNGKENELTEQDVREAFCTEDGDVLYFVRWEEPDSWSML